jgi:hypothetical protein
LKDLRDAYDVAHHHLDPARIDDVKTEFGEAAQIATEVISCYRDKRLGEAEAPLTA